jgi:leucyl aminopeptidase
VPDTDTAEAACEAVVAAALAADFPLPAYKRDPKERAQAQRRRWREIHLYGHTAAHGYARTIAAARGNNLARYLTALPPNELTPARYRRLVEGLARRYGWKSEFFGLARLRRLGAGAFLAVARGAEDPAAGILHLRYVPKGKTAAAGQARRLALVGKGICFDTGGTNLKPARHMHGMHEDMAGSAVALGVLLALTELEADFAVDCWLALARNEIGPRAYRQNEVVRAANGSTIEIVHTDAEGRLVLADTLALATRAARPELLIDYATLTGSCIGALSTRLCGAFTNREALLPALIETGRRAGERVWPFPLEQDYDEELESDIADIKQCTLEAEADHILAGRFLGRFLEHDPDWVHLDLSACRHKGGLAHIPTDITGFGVRFTLQFLQDQGWLSRARARRS